MRPPIVQSCVAEAHDLRADAPAAAARGAGPVLCCAALAAAALLGAACGRQFANTRPDAGADPRPAPADLDGEVQRARSLESDASRLGTEADQLLHAGDLAFIDGDVAAGRDHYIAAGRLYEQAAEQRRLASDVATGVRARWTAQSRHAATADVGNAPR